MKRILRIALNKAAREPKQAVIGTSEGIRRFGYLAKSIRIKSKVFDNGGAFAIIGPSKSYVRTKGKYTRGKHKGQPRRFFPAKYAHLVEKGTSHSKAKPFLQPAMEETKNPFFNAICAAMKEQIEMALSRRK